MDTTPSTGSVPDPEPKSNPQAPITTDEQVLAALRRLVSKVHMDVGAGGWPEIMGQAEAALARADARPVNSARAAIDYCPECERWTFHLDAKCQRHTPDIEGKRSTGIAHAVAVLASALSENAAERRGTAVVYVKHSDGHTAMTDDGTTNLFEIVEGPHAGKRGSYAELNELVGDLWCDVDRDSVYETHEIRPF